jgi:uncharacterized protein YcbK (DUF882 family)
MIIEGQTTNAMVARLVLVVKVDGVCRKYNASVTSWWRTIEHNARLPGAAAASLHLQGLALDVVYDGKRPTLSELQALGLRVIREKDHDHLELAEGEQNFELELSHPE